MVDACLAGRPSPYLKLPDWNMGNNVGIVTFRLWQYGREVDGWNLPYPHLSAKLVVNRRVEKADELYSESDVCTCAVQSQRRQICLYARRRRVPSRLDQAECRSFGKLSRAISVLWCFHGAVTRLRGKQTSVNTIGHLGSYPRAYSSSLIRK